MISTENKNESRLQGSFTVEATFVMTIIIFLLLIIIEYTMVVHDRVTAESIIRESVLDARNECEEKINGIFRFDLLSQKRMFFKERATVAEEYEKTIKEQSKKKLFYTYLSDIRMSCNSGRVKLTAVLHPKKTFSFLSAYVRDVRCEIELEEVKSTEKTRIATVLTDTFSKVFASPFIGGKYDDKKGIPK